MRGIKYEPKPLEQAVLEAIQSLASGTQGASLVSIAFLVRSNLSAVRAMVDDLHIRGIVGWKEGTEGRHWHLATGKNEN